MEMPDTRVLIDGRVWFVRRVLVLRVVSYVRLVLPPVDIKDLVSCSQREEISVWCTLADWQPMARRCRLAKKSRQDTGVAQDMTGQKREGLSPNMYSSEKNDRTGEPSSSTQRNWRVHS